MKRGEDASVNIQEERVSTDYEEFTDYDRNSDIDFYDVGILAAAA